MSKEKVLITGASGSLGTALRADTIVSDMDVLAPSSQEFSVADLRSCRDYLHGQKIKYLIHAAALTNWEKCESDPVHSLLVNAFGALNMALIAREHKARLIYISTDAVFEGALPHGYNERDKPLKQVSVYGRTKYFGEKLSVVAGELLMIIRLGWLFGPTPQKDKRFVGAILRQIASGRTRVQAVSDNFASPTSATDAANKILQLMLGEKQGVRHVINHGIASKYDVALAMKENWKLDTIQVDAATSESFPSLIPRPKHVGLTTINHDAALRPWEDSLLQYSQQFPEISQFSND